MINNNNQPKGDNQQQAEKATNAKASKAKTNTTEKAKERQAEAPEVQALKQRIAELEKALQSKEPQSLEERIAFLQRKNELIKRLEKMTSYAEVIAQTMEEILADEKEEQFISESFSVTITRKQGYSSEKEILKMRQPQVIREVLGYCLGRINEKREELQTEINA